MTRPVEDLPNIGKTLGKRLRKVGIETAEEFERRATPSIPQTLRRVSRGCLRPHPARARRRRPPHPLARPAAGGAGEVTRGLS